LAWTLAHEFIRPLAFGLDAGTASRLRSAETIASVVNLARTNHELAATVEAWRGGPYLLGTPGGAVDLRTGELREARPGDQITKLTTVAPAPPGLDARLQSVQISAKIDQTLD
jgi:putative DNA primase/helicase